MKEQTDSPSFNDFSAPIPGQSLTMPQGSTPMESPPQFANPQDAAEYIFDQFVQPRQSVRVLAILRKGASCESIARTVLFTGVAQGKWTVDSALLLARPILYLIVAIANRMKSNKLLKTFEIMNEDVEQQQFFENLGGLGELEEEYNVDEGDIKAAEGDLKKSKVELKGMLEMGNKEQPQ